MDEKMLRTARPFFLYVGLLSVPSGAYPVYSDQCHAVGDGCVSLPDFTGSAGLAGWSVCVLADSFDHAGGPGLPAPLWQDCIV